MTKKEWVMCYNKDSKQYVPIYMYADSAFCVKSGSKHSTQIMCDIENQRFIIPPSIVNRKK